MSDPDLDALPVARVQPVPLEVHERHLERPAERRELGVDRARVLGTELERRLGPRPLLEEPDPQARRRMRDVESRLVEPRGPAAALSLARRDVVDGADELSKTSPSYERVPPSRCATPCTTGSRSSFSWSETTASVPATRAASASA